MMPQSLLKFALFALFALISNVQSKTKGLRDATETQFPWLVALNVAYEDGTIKFCAGSIIKSRWILSTATCVKRAKKAEIYVARIDMNSFSGFTAVTDEFVINTDYQEDAFYADIALIKLKTDLCFNGSVQPIQLPDHELEDFAVVTLPGWEWDDQKKIWISSYLHYRELSVTPIAECKKYYGYFYNSSFCTTTGLDPNPCESNAGAGAIAYYTDEATLVGVHSFVAAQCKPNSPMGFVSVYQYKSWIQEITGL